MALFAGIDPGKTGYVALIDPDAAKVVEAWPQPLIGDGKGDTYDKRRMFWIARELHHRGVVRVGIEAQWPQGRGRGSATVFFQQGLAFGLWQMALVAVGLSYVEVRPQKWRKVVGVPQAKLEREAAPPEGTPEHKEWAKRNQQRLGKQRELGLLEYVRLVQARFPGVNLLPSPRAKKPSADLAAAILIAQFAYYDTRGGSPATPAPKKKRSSASDQVHVDDEILEDLDAELAELDAED